MLSLNVDDPPFLLNVFDTHIKKWMTNICLVLMWMEQTYFYMNFEMLCFRWHFPMNIPDLLEFAGEKKQSQNLKGIVYFHSQLLPVAAKGKWHCRNEQLWLGFGSPIDSLTSSLSMFLVVQISRGKIPQSLKGFFFSFVTVASGS